MVPEKIFHPIKLLSSEAGWSGFSACNELFRFEKEGRGGFFSSEKIFAMKLLQVKGPLINTKEEAMKALGIDKRLIGELDYGVTIKVAIYQNWNFS